MMTLEEIIEELEAIQDYMDRKDCTIGYGQISALVEQIRECNKAPVSRSTDYYITDGYGSYWSSKCNKCRKHSMQVVRPGEVQCKYCG